MLILNSPEVVQETILRWKRETNISFVPTMGCLHEGHLALVRKAKNLGKKCVVSIFVNPLQFGPHEDFQQYPRTFEQDVEMLKELEVDLVFAPPDKDLYPDGFCTQINVRHLTENLCGKFRKGHFEGVATICLKLFQITLADYAIFGEKDFQQLRVIQQMVSDLNLPLSVVPHETVREPDGLALSSRNRYLSPDDRIRAALFAKTLKEAASNSLTNAKQLVGDLKNPILKQLLEAHIEIEYIEVAGERDLVPAAPEIRMGKIVDPRLFGAVRIGSTRLIDNIRLYSKEL